MPEIGEYSIYVNPKEGIPVPPVPLRLKVTADGYEPWHYGGADWLTGKRLIKPKPGETLKLSIRLKRKQAE